MPNYIPTLTLNLAYALITSYIIDTADAITHPCPNFSSTIVVKWTTCVSSTYLIVLRTKTTVSLPWWLISLSESLHTRGLVLFRLCMVTYHLHHDVSFTRHNDCSTVWCLQAGITIHPYVVITSTCILFLNLAFYLFLPGWNGRHFGRRQFQMHFLERKW